MFRTQGVLALLALYVGLAHSFSWEFVMLEGNELVFYNDGRVTHKEHINYDINRIAYDPVHNHVLFTNINSQRSTVYSFDIRTKKIEPIISMPGDVKDFAFDSLTETIFWIEENNYFSLNSYSLKLGSSNLNNGSHLIKLDTSPHFKYIAVDSCGGYIYWVAGSQIEKAKFDGSEREIVIVVSNFHNQIMGLAIDELKLYWTELFISKSGYESFVNSADLNGENRTTLFIQSLDLFKSLTVSNDFIYWGSQNHNSFWQLPKISSHDRVNPKESINNGWCNNCDIAANYKTHTKESCEAAKTLLPTAPSLNNSNDYYLDEYTDIHLLCVHGTKISGEHRCECTQGYSGERCDVSVCHNYCFQGNCSVSDEGQPKCRCNAGYTGARCLVNLCQDYCLGNGVCSLNEKNEPVCQCTGDYDGVRCDIPVFLVKCSQSVSMLRNILNIDFTQVALGKGVKSERCAPSAV